MKKVLSLIIVVALVIGMIPVMASAAETIVINFTGNGEKTPLEIDYDTAGWEVDENGTCQYLLGDKWTTKTYLNNSTGLYVYFDNAAADGERIALNFNVGTSGWYDISAEVSTIIKYGTPYCDGYMSIWIDGQYIGQLNTVEGKTGINKLRPLYLEAGKHSFFLHADEAVSQGRFMRTIIKNVTLTPTTEAKAKLASVEIAFSGDNIGTGEAVPVTATLAFANGTKIKAFSKSSLAGKYPSYQTSGDVYSLSAGDADIASVSKDTLTMLKSGTTEVIFSANLGKNGTASVSSPITVLEKITLRYNDSKSWETSSSTNNYLSSETRGINWTIVTDKKYTDPRHFDGTTGAIRLQGAVPYAYVYAKGPFTVNLTVPKAGLYDITAIHTAYPKNSIGDVYVNDEYVGSFNDDGNCAVTETTTSTLLTTRLAAGENRVTIYTATGRIFPVAFEFKVTNTADTLAINATLDKSEIAKGETATISMSATASDGTIYQVKEGLFSESTLNATYKSSNEKVATVSASGVITAVGAGEAVISVSADYPASTSAYKKDFTVTVPKTAPGEAAAETVSVYVGTTVGGDVSATGVSAKTVESVVIGKSVSAKAIPADGYEFAYWKDSAGNFVSENETYNFKAYTNTSVIAVFDAIGETSSAIGVEFFDGNRDYLGLQEVSAGTVFADVTKPTGEMTGYDFIGWNIKDDEKINSLVRAVAMYAETGKNVSGIKFNGTARNATYSEEIGASDANAKAWYRDGRLVAYGSTYTYLAWGETEITSATEDVSEKLPLAVLDSDGDAYMLEYDAAGHEIVDAGIIFGNDSHNAVNSCYYKAKVKDIKSHGQFTAKKSRDTEFDQSVVRGYVIFKDSDNSLRVIYSN